jgi:hypothetical protein
MPAGRSGRPSFRDVHTGLPHKGSGEWSKGRPLAPLRGTRGPTLPTGHARLVLRRRPQQGVRTLSESQADIGSRKGTGNREWGMENGEWRMDHTPDPKPQTPDPKNPTPDTPYPRRQRKGPSPVPFRMSSYPAQRPCGRALATPAQGPRNPPPFGTPSDATPLVRGIVLCVGG